MEVRTCLKINYINELDSVKNNLAISPQDPCFGAFRGSLEVLRVPSEEIQPAECALADPAPPDGYEPPPRRRARGNLDLQSGDVVFHPALESLAVGFVNEDLLHPVEVAQAVLDQQVRLLPVGDVGRVHDHAPAQPQRVDDHVPLAAVDFLVTVRPPFAVHEGSEFNGLTVNAQQTGSLFLSLAFALDLVQLAVQPLQRAVEAPLAEIVINDLPAKLRVLQIAPLGTRAQDFQNSVDDVSQIVSALALVVQDLFYNLPAGIGELIKLGLHLILSLVTQK